MRQIIAGITFKVLGSHKLQDIKDILVGLGLQAVRVRIGHAVSYLFLTRSIVKSRELFSMLEQCFLSIPVQSSDSFLHSMCLEHAKQLGTGANHTF